RSHHALPSFPTRRSSDLGGYMKVSRALRRRRLGILARFLAKLPKGGKFDMSLWGNHPESDHAPAASHACGTTACVLGWAAMIPRSEEHTSELQSLRHLVC